MSNIDAAREIERLLQFARKQGMIEELDKIPARNALLDLFQLGEPYEGSVPEEDIPGPVEILDNLLDYAAEAGIIEQNTVSFRDLFDARIMGLLMPRQSEVVRNFNNTVREYGIEKATDDFYSLSKASNYIRMDRIEKNLYWLSPTEYGPLEITINLSKPEKDPREIAAAKARPQSSYPKCLLCLENVGYAGHINHPARQNHRVIPVNLAGEQWYFQYSPYVYYNEHCILFHEKHVPMKISQRTFQRLFGFVEQFPHYFIGSNADLPIVGGSILSHEHFQGGRHVFSMEQAHVEAEYAHPGYEGIKGGIVKWPMSVLRLSGRDKNKLIEFSFNILNHWREYTDEAADILSYTLSDGEKVRHNTITPIVRKNRSGEFEIDLVLRNNRTTEQYPYGIFHPHEELHHIKKENIGLIEVMGLAILPARLNFELKDIENILCGKTKLQESYKEDLNNGLNKHADWIDELIKKYGIKNTEENAAEIMRHEVGDKFLKVLLDAGVYKRNENGMAAFNRFMESAGFVKVLK